jgi:hypothetical protein
MKILNRSIFMAFLTLVSCVSGNAPQMERKVKIWNGAPEEIGICRLSTNDLSDKLNAVKFVLKSYHAGTSRYECLPAEDERFKSYACLTFEDLGVMYAYIQELNFKCEKWAK